MATSQTPNVIGRPIIFGEVLFDCFADGQNILGGAPFNVAWHLQGFACSPLMISSVGKDDRGDSVRATMQDWGMDVSGLQLDGKHPTGQVTVHLRDGQPSYDIVTDQAYDHINAPAALSAIKKSAIKHQQPALIYHGSLALREECSRASLDALLQETELHATELQTAGLQATDEDFSAPIFLDLNLRTPWWEMSRIEPLLQRATWVKLNDEELCEVTRHPLTSGPELQTYAEDLFNACQLERLIVTQGAQGAFVVSKDGIVNGKPVPVKDIVDTVGAGDAFSAVMIVGILQAWPIKLTLDRALMFASAICQQRGATAHNPDLYRL